MSKPTIYWFGGTGMTADRYGFRGNRMEDSQGYIRFTNYAALAAENERLKAEVEWLRKADRLVCWNPATQAWEVRFEAPK